MLHRRVILSIWSLSVFVNLIDGDTHESLVKQTASGNPYYVRKTAHLPTHQIPEIYDTVYPVVFEFTTPNWSRPINLIGYTCTGDDYDNDGWSCPILWYWLTGVRDKLQEEIYVENMKARDTSKFPTDIVCDQLRQVFDGLYLDEESRSEFLSFATSPTNCQSSQTTLVPRSDKYVANAIDAPYRTMREKFFTEYYSLQTPLNRSNDAMYTNARYNLYSSGLFEYHIESRRWTQALAECKANRIPNTLITPQDLQQVLSVVAANASVNGLELVVGISELSKYYKLTGISDCAFTPNSMIVTLQVPVRLLRNSGHKILEYHPVPYFNEQGQVCQINFKDNQYISDPFSQNTLTNAKELHCNENNGFCHLTSEVERGFEAMTSCPQILYQEGDDSEICKVQCTNKKFVKLPIVRKVSDDRILVFGSGRGKKNEVKIVCPEFQKMEPIDSSKQAVEVTIPCGCEIHKNGKSVFKVRGDKCGSEVHIIKA